MSLTKFLGVAALLQTSNAFNPQALFNEARLHSYSTQAPAQTENLASQSLFLDADLDLGDVDITTRARFRGLTTFANLPYVSCFEKESNDERADIMVVGAPFDTGVSARPGARYGPQGIRVGSERFSPDFDFDETGFNLFKQGATIVDCGDSRMLPFDNRIALAQLQKAHEVIASRETKNKTFGSIPRIVTLGGDHTITLPALRAASKKWGAVTLLHFDSHIDTWSPDFLPHLGEVTKYAGVNHGTWGWHAWNEKLISADNNLHVGIRCPFSNAKEDLETDKKAGFEIIYAKAIDRIGVSGVISAIKARVGDTKVYLSVDIDVLDPAFAPATGTPETGGYSTRELLAILDGLAGVNIIGADIVEVAPAYDSVGQITSLAAASIAHSILGLMVKQPVKN